MYILTQGERQIVDSLAFSRFNIVDQDDAILIVCSKNYNDHPITLGRYTEQSEAKGVLRSIFHALGRGEEFFEMPYSAVMAREHKVCDKRTVRKGGS